MMKFFKYKRLSISKKLLILVLATSTFGTTITSLIQVFIEFQEAKNAQQLELELFKSSTVPSLENLVWNFNETAISTQLQSTVSTPDFFELNIVDDSGKLINQAKKNIQFKTLNQVQFDLKNPQDRNELIGKVTLIYTNDYIVESVTKKATIIIVTNFIKTLIISSLLVILFRIHIVNGMLNLVTYLNNQDWSKPSDFKNVKNKWPFEDIQDEFNDVEKSLIDAVEMINKKNEALAQSALSNARLAELGVLSAGIAHEINNPLTIIKSYASTIQKNNTYDKLIKDQVEKYCAGIIKSCHRISEIITGLKTLSRDGSKDKFEVYLITKLKEDISGFCELTLNKKGITYTFEIEDVNLHLYCKPVQISQVILNLINNASDAIHDLEEKWIRVQFKRNSNNSIICTVTDSGSGIPEEVRKNMFAPFYTTKELGKGTGLGLSIVKGIVDQHKGTIQVNENCKNTQFIITFPQIEEVEHVA